MRVFEVVMLSCFPTHDLLDYFMVRVSRVLPDSIAAELGIVPGTELQSVNGRELADFLDWEFLTADDDARRSRPACPTARRSSTTSSAPKANRWASSSSRPPFAAAPTAASSASSRGCPRGCGARSTCATTTTVCRFAYGNFATLSNLKDRDIARILEYRLSPLYVSVHATPWEARKVLLNNPRVPNIVDQLTRLAAGGIQFHAQMVIVPGLNDGDVLEQSFTDLWDLGDAVLSVAIVPVGLTQFSHLYTGKSMDAAAAPDAARGRGPVGASARSPSAGDRWVYGSDELYLLAGRALPGRRRSTATSRRSRTASARWRRCASASPTGWRRCRGSTARRSAS